VVATLLRFVVFGRFCLFPLLERNSTVYGHSEIARVPAALVSAPAPVLLSSSEESKDASTGDSGSGLTSAAAVSAFSSVERLRFTGIVIGCCFGAARNERSALRSRYSGGVNWVNPGIKPNPKKGDDDGGGEWDGGG